MSVVYADRTPQCIDLSKSKDLYSWAVGPALAGTIQVQSSDGSSWGGATVSVMRSNNGMDWYSFVDAVELSSDGLTPTLDLSGVGYVCVVVTTAAGSSVILDMWGVFKA